MPAISGSPRVGYTLKAAAGTWTSGTTPRYQWYRSGTAIIGATGSGYTLGASDQGKAMTVKVTGSKTGYTTIRKTSAQTPAVLAGYIRSTAPAVSGSPKVGSTLKASVGAWTYGTRLRYQWYRSGKVIQGGTASKYRVVAADKSRALKVRVTGSKPGYKSAVRTSAPTARTIWPQLSRRHPYQGGQAGCRQCVRAVPQRCPGPAGGHRRSPGICGTA